MHIKSDIQARSVERLNIRVHYKKYFLPLIQDFCLFCVSSSAFILCVIKKQ